MKTIMLFLVLLLPSCGKKDENQLRQLSAAKVIFQDEYLNIKNFVEWERTEKLMTGIFACVLKFEEGEILDSVIEMRNRDLEFASPENEDMLSVMAAHFPEESTWGEVKKAPSKNVKKGTRITILPSGAKWQIIVYQAHAKADGILTLYALQIEERVQ